MSAHEHIEELLSGFLDGELNAEELREFESAMLVDPTLGRKLDQLRQLGSDLRSVPKRTLGPDFSSRVLAVARREALATPNFSHAQQANGRRANWRRANWQVVGFVSALAASLLIAAYVSNWFSGPMGGLAEVPPLETQPDAIGTVGTDSQKESFVRNDPNLRKRIGGQNEFAVLAIFEIEPSMKAWNENLVATVLRDAGIAWTNPVNVSDEVIDVLNETRSISQGLPKSGGDQMALVMVMANGLKMDKALNRIWQGENDFPNVIMDMAFDLPGKELCQKLVDAQISIANGQKAIATPIVIGASGTAVNGGLEGVSQFSGARPASYLAATARQSQQFETAVTTEEEDAINYVLLVIRKPAK